MKSKLMSVIVGLSIIVVAIFGAKILSELDYIIWYYFVYMR